MLTHEKLAAARALVDACPAGPWHWLCDPGTRRIRIEGPPRVFGPWFETVVDFCRYGMSGAAPRFRRYDPAEDGPGEMVRADLGSVPIPGREHHADWARKIVHPVGRLMVEARTLIPELLDEVEWWRAGGCYEYVDPATGKAVPRSTRVDTARALDANTAKLDELVNGALAQSERLLLASLAAADEAHAALEREGAAIREIAHLRAELDRLKQESREVPPC